VKRFSIGPRTRAYVRDDFLREKEHLVEVSKWNHPHLLGMLATFETKCSGFETLNIVLPFARGGNLYDFLRLEQETRWERRGFPSPDPSLVGCLADWRYAVFRETVGLADAVAALHADNDGKFIIHCDIKPANVLIEGGKFKLADFGLSRFKDSDETSKTEWYRGTALYSPPERESLLGRGRDVWALGCVFLEVTFMIRYAFQFAIFGKVGLTQDPIYEGLRNIIDMFELDRKNSISKTGERTAIYYKTMDCVREAMGSFYIMRPGLRKRITVDGMFPVIKRMMEEDQTTRITATEVAAQLRANYLSLQDDPELQEAITERDNPGGPPAVPFTDDDRKHFRPGEGGVSFNHLPSNFMSLQAAQRDTGQHHPPLFRNATAPTGSSGATEKMAGVGLETRRTVSSENTPYHHLPENSRLTSPRDLGGAMPRPNTFGNQDHRRSSSYEDDTSKKRRRTDANFRS
jgi:serine/threonine protein kinase